MKTHLTSAAGWVAKLSCALALFVDGAHAAPLATLQVEQGILTGAKGVVLDGKRFDVSFIDGTCEATIGGCSFHALTFRTLDQANAASRALAEQVFVDTNQGAFDTNPALTRGCTYDENCLILTPYFINSLVTSSELVNWAGPGIGVLYPNGFDEVWDVDSTRIINVTFARWTLSPDAPAPAPVPVPEPNTLALIAISGLAFGRRRHR